MDDGCEDVVPAVQPHVQREQEAHEDFVGKHNQRLDNVEGVTCEGRRRRRPAAAEQQ
jgi:hypothetical protein